MRDPMIDFESARVKIFYATPMPGTKTVSLARCEGYVLAEKIATKEPVPSFDSSAVDGYAVRYEDIETIGKNKPVALNIVGEVRAGGTDDVKLGKNSAVKIFTGAPVPRQATAVVMIEDTEESNGVVFIKKSAKRGQHIRKKGKEFRKGQKIFSPGKYISPPVVAMLASSGVTKIKVYRKPRVSLLVTGDELRPPSATLKPGEIRDSNSFALKASLQSMGIDNIEVMRVKDTEADTRRSFLKALKTADVVISVGGVSVGEYDLVKEILHKIGVRQIFWRVAIKPGKPNYFGVKGKKLIFGLPGNPVSALVSFYVLVRPALWKLMGRTDESSFIVKARLTDTITKLPGRMEFVRGIVNRTESGELFVSPLKSRDSHMIGGMAAANCLIYFPKNCSVLESSSSVDVQVLVW